ncbi:NADH-quinone oxidoreductase subunit L [Streptomyces sp. LX-29]|uniref:NADH-quinone oxidoreductase subunit 5 family protein n=1 Tax=Streptomyces sp. LX-29 TaxID=2900152 RepID=UPI00240E3075|nr:NADH-quinone oxidoreductase subunit L [Streptomyces sp. LX-29]WFB07995.1 NADH-quinone oxidoreductase subunit L [Streptomyces sp. LX-29]
MTITTTAALVPLLPFLGAVAGLLLGRRAPGFVRPLAVLPALAAAALATVVAVRQNGGDPVGGSVRLADTGSIPIDLAFHIDGFAALVAVLVGVVASCVQIFSTGYLRDDPRYPSYAALVSLFTAAMLLVVYSDDLIVLLVGWEIMGICSYFLVGHYWETAAARSASLKAFLVTKLGDVPFLIGIFALAADAGTFRISTIYARLTSSVSDFQLDQPTLIALLLLAGVAGKSAQFPLHSWLPDAMAGPTPVSALIHAATMVAAGVYFIARLLPVFTSSAAALVVMGIMAAITMIGSALCALAQDDIKRVLAYSTIGQLGYMTGALAVGDRGAGVFHLMTHGAFKALLFLAAGVIIYVAGTNSLTEMARAGGVRRLAPDAYRTLTVGLIALAALPPFSGFFSKEAVLSSAEHTALGHAHGIPAAAGWTVLVAGLLTALLTAAYATRLWLLAGNPGRATRAAKTVAPEPPAPAEPPARQVPLAMNLVLWVLAVPALTSGLLFNHLPGWFDDRSLDPTLTTSLVGTGLALAGGLITYGAWRRTAALAAPAPLVPTAGPAPAAAGAEPALVEAGAIASHEQPYTHEEPYPAGAAAPDHVDPGRLLLGPLHPHAAAGFHLDAVYTALFVRPVRAAATLVRFLDREVVDAYVRGAGTAPGLLGAAVRRAQTGNVQTYLSALLAGSLVLAVAAVLVAAGA